MGRRLGVTAADGGWRERVRVASQSLRFRLTLGMSLALGLVLCAFVMLQYQLHRERIIDEAKTHLSNVGQIIEGSLEHAMVTRDLAELQQIMDNVSRQRNIRSIILLNKQGEIRFAPQGEGVGTHLDPKDPGCQACHQMGAAVQGTSAISTDPQGERVLRNCNPILNRPSCHSCHGQEDSLTGVLVTDYSLADTNDYLNAELRTNLIAGLAVIVAVVLVVNLLLERLMLGKLDQMMLAIRRFGAGDRSQRAATGGADEIGRLAATFNQMADGLQAKEQETTRLYHELQHKDAARAQLLRQVMQAQEEERKRIARELHDDLAQMLTAVSLGLETAVGALPEAMASVREHLAHIRDLMSDALGQTYRSIQDLRPLVLDDLGLVPALRWYAGVRLEPCGTELSLEAKGPQERLATELETMLFRVIQEALNNVAKHARARHVWVRLDFSAAQIVAEIEDDGAGFDLADLPSDGESMRGIGLLGMRERVALVGGRLAVDSVPGQGTRIRIEVPWTT